MKNWKRIYSSLFVFALLSILISCEDMMDVHKEYIKGGEIIYAPKPDSIAFYAGKGRIKFRFWLYNSPNVTSVDLYWNSYADSLIIPVTPGTGLDSSEVILENMSEKAYTFYVKTTDQYGNSSLEMTDFGTSYGDSYKESLSQRKVRSATMSGTDGIIDWYSAAEDLVEVQVRYKSKTSDDRVVVVMPADDDEIICPNVEGGSSFDFRSLYIPEEGAIDTFALEWEQSDIQFPSTFKYDRTGWSVISCSDQQPDDGGGVETLLDGDYDSYWHSSYSDGAAPLPHWAIIDLNEAKNVIKIETWRPGNTDANTVQYWTSDDSDPNASSWEKIGEGVFSSDADLLTVSFNSVVTTKRYLKLVLTDSNRVTYTSISEIFLYGKY
jgi:hypothetical protein